MVFATTSATIVTDTLSPTCTSSGGRYCKDLYVDAEADRAVKYTVNDVKAGNYTVSFMYKLQSGKFEFSMTPESGVAPVTLADTTWKRFSKSFEIAADQPTVVLRFKAKELQAIFRLDDIQMTLSPEPTRFNNFKYETGCCPADYCWNGTGCVHAKFYEKDVTMPPLGWDIAEFGNADDLSSFLDAPNGYRCINGTWKFTRIKFTPLYDAAGYCPDDNQCFKGVSTDVEDRTPEAACTESGDFIDYSVGKRTENFYCYKGNWTTRTKEIALQLLNMTKSSDTYTLFCDDFNRALNPDETMSYYRDYVGDNIANILTSNLSNEFCVLDLNGKVIVGVSLNKEINETSAAGGCIPCGWSALSEGACVDGCLADRSGASAPKSFLQIMKGSNKNTYCDSVISNRDGAYNACKEDIKDVFYNAKLKTVIFTKMQELPNDDRQSVPLTTTVNFINRIIEAIRSVFRNLLGIAGLANPQLESAYKSQLDFVAKAGSFNKLYLSFSPPENLGDPVREIKAVRETRASILPDGIVKIKTFISAEYHNYQSDICRFFYMHNYPDLRDQISKHEEQNIQCTPVILDEDNWMYSVYVEQPFFAEIDDIGELRPVQVWIGDSDSFWNDITAAIRTQSPPIREDSSPPIPTFEFTPRTPVVGTVINFSLTLPAEQERNLIARTWDFGDGEKASSAYNITTFHNYTEARETGGYAVSLWVMDRNFRIAKSVVQEIVVNVSPQISMDVKEQTQNDRYASRINITFTITGGNRPYYNVNVNWDDGNITTVSNDEINGTGFFSMVHSYAESEFPSGRNMIKPRVVAEGWDRDNVYFFISDEVSVTKEARPPLVVMPVFMSASIASFP
jgi:PKD repeat protein